MNMEMMILCDCIGQAGNIELYEYVQLLSEICEVRAIAHKDLHDSHAKRRDQNNMYLVWSYLHPEAKPEHFLKWVDEFCERKLTEYSVRESRFFDQALYNGIMATLESYYTEVPVKMVSAKL